MQGVVWYNQVVSPKVEKKTVQIGVKISDSLNSLIEEICTNEDRPVGYVARELMIRGLALYRLDGKLRDDVQTSVQPASKIAAYIGPGDKTQVLGVIRGHMKIYK